MTAKPRFFDRIRTDAARRWDQYEADPELAAPARLLFSQVQSPRHVLSELLQNADDAGATDASVRVEDGVFVFAHNGTDFTEDEFQSLCRFGYSNKRVLHTIGFRGVGFKSTFSLGDVVEVHTPTLSLAFDKSRFTEPRWLGEGLRKDRRTVIRVSIEAASRVRELQRNLDEWLRSPLSLLFFHNLRRLQIEDSEIRVQGTGSGPVDSCEWIEIDGQEMSRLLVLRSQEETWPVEALDEIRSERMLFDQEDFELAPSAVEVVLGTEGRLYVVLPTEVEADLPFACNAPFVQDPARDRIKDPDISPTNQWLLERIGVLVGSVMLQWLANSELGLDARAAAYELFPPSSDGGSSLASSCARVVRDAFMRTIEDEPCLLTEAGRIVPRDESVVVPDPLLLVWSPGQVAALLDQRGRWPLARYVSDRARTRLVRAGLLEEVTLDTIIHALGNKAVKKPDTWHQLRTLWAYVGEHGSRSFYWRYKTPRALKLVPVSGAGYLASAEDVVRLPARIGRLGTEDARLLRGLLPVVDSGWLRYLQKDRTAEQQDGQIEGYDELNQTIGLLEELQLHRPSDMSKAIELVATRLFAQPSVSIADGVRFAHIAARLNAALSPDSAARFVTRDKARRSARQGLLFDADGSLEELLPDDWAQEHVLHPAYGRSFSTCSRDEWNQWLASERSPLHTCVPLVRQEDLIWSRAEVASEIERRGGPSDVEFPYEYDRFVTEDWDFPSELWGHWRARSEAGDELWGQVMVQVILSGEWRSSDRWDVTQIARNGAERKFTAQMTLAPSWVLEFRGHPCLLDTDGHARLPYDLLLRSKETEPVFGIEPFVHHDLDAPETRELLLALGVGDKPSGPGRLLERIRALAGADNSPLSEVESLYRRLDRLADTSSTEELAEIKEAFLDEQLVRSEDGDWRPASFVFLTPDDDDAPGVPVVWSVVRDLTLWRRIGVLDRPTADHAIRWLASFKAGDAVNTRDLKRVRALLKRHPERIWHECGQWLNLASEWTRVVDLEYSLIPDSDVKTQHLHEWINEATADFRMLSQEALAASPFSQLPNLAATLDRRLESEPPVNLRHRKPWLESLGSELTRVVLKTEEETHRVRSLASRLAQTNWAEADHIRVLPFLDGKPAATPADVDAAWIGRTLYVVDRPVATVAPAVSRELSSAFSQSDVADAVKLCFERDPRFVREYVEATFELDSAVAATPASEAHTDSELELELPGEEGPTSPSNLGEPGESSEDGDVDVGDLTLDDERANQDPEVRRTRRQQMGIVERYALKHGYQPQGQGIFVHRDGTRLVRQLGGLFPWEKHSPDGDLIVRYWGKDHVLERRPLEIGSDIWNGLEADPRRSALVLTDPSGEPVVLSGEAIAELKASGRLRLFPATYRVRLESPGSRLD